MQIYVENYVLCSMLQVRMLGNGRPFIIEICNARVIPSVADMKKAEAEINSIKEGWVSLLSPLSNLGF